jgi:beta-lactam-binding protein with PASTA domain
MKKTWFFVALAVGWVMLSSISFGYSGGTGQPNAPYQIADANDLLELAGKTEDYSKCFILTADINLEGENFSSAVIAPDTIKDELLDFNGNAFTGVFDGSGHKILNLVIEAQNADYLGLFGQIGTSGIVKDLRLENCSVSLASNYVGALAGYNNGGFIIQCSAAVTVYSSCDATGGLVGQNTGSITRCCSTGQVHGNIQVGGLVGCNTGAVGNCYSTCNISGVPRGTLTQITGNEYRYGAGGLVGYNKGGLIEKSYSTGSVTGGYIGGLVGSSGYYEDSIVWQCNWICDDQGNCWEDCIPLPTSNFIYSEDWVQDSFWDMGSSGCSFSAGGSPTWGNINQFLNAGWDFAVETLNGTDDIWVMFQGQYPQFAWQWSIAGDIVLPYGVGIDDLQKFARHWLQTNCPNECEGADLTGDGLVDLFDFSILAEHWQQTTLLGTTVAVPDLSGLTYEDAVALLITAGLQAGYWGTSYSETVPNEHIISQNPVAGSIVYPNTAVDIVVSQGSNVVYVPNVVGMSQSDARMLLQTIQLMAAVTYSYSDTVEANYVISQNPVAGTKSYYDCTVNLVVSLGPSTIVPDIMGMTQASAESEISNAMLIIGEVTYDYSIATTQGSVISQNPAAGTIVTQNSAVDIAVSLGHPYTGGTGTRDDPFRISTAEQMNRIGLRPEDWDKSFVLVNSIDMFCITDTQYNIIGNIYNYFQGTFDGKGHVISNFTYQTRGTSYISSAGLFGAAANAMIKNLGLENVIIHVATKSPSCYVGGLVGVQSEGTIVNCYSSNSEITLSFSSATGSSTYGAAGGLAGSSSGIIYNCYATGMVQASSWLSDAGGLVGSFGYGRIENSYSTGSAYAYSSSFQSNCGGLVGKVSNGIITNCYSTDSVYVSNSDFLALGGGLIGSAWYSAKIENCFSSGKVTSDDKNRIISGLIGTVFSSTVKDCFWDIQTSGMTRGADSATIEPNDVIGKATAEMKAISTFTSAGWDFTNEITNGMEDVWRMCADGIDYPKLNWESIQGDFECPNGVKQEDLSVLYSCWLQVVQYPSDINGDNIVDLTDLKILSQRWLVSNSLLSGGADITGDGNVDQADLEMLINQWLFEENTACRMVDLNVDGRIDLVDYAIFATHWLEQI